MRREGRRGQPSKEEVAAGPLAILFGVDGTLISTGGAGTRNWRLGVGEPPWDPRRQRGVFGSGHDRSCRRPQHLPQRHRTGADRYLVGLRAARKPSSRPAETYTSPDRSDPTAPQAHPVRRARSGGTSMRYSGGRSTAGPRATRPARGRRRPRVSVEIASPPRRRSRETR